MVRVNLITPRFLTDQHLIAEYNEVLMLIEYIRKSSVLDDIPPSYVLGKGHMKFFKNKVGYLEKRFNEIVKEMSRRGFKARKKFPKRGIHKAKLGNYKPSDSDKKIIKKRIEDKIKMKPDWYRYYGERKGKRFLVGMTRRGR